MTDSLINKYRPQTFDEVIGQDAVVKSLQGALAAKRGRAFLFTGPAGTGKTTLARITAKTLGCIDANLEEVDAATQTGIDDMRSIAEGLQYQPLGGGVKVVIVDECHGLSVNAWRSLLKIVEEPPEWVGWCFCTTDPGKVPDNIRTRCLRYDLKPVSRGDLTALLDAIVADEKMDLPSGVLDLCIQEAQGSPRQAISNLAVCAGADDRTEAARLLRSAAASDTAVELARALVRGAKWAEVQALLNGFKDINPESARHIVLGYVTKVVLNAKQEAAAGRGLEIVDAFSTPFPHSNGMSALVLACGRVLLS